MGPQKNCSFAEQSCFPLCVLVLPGMTQASGRVVWNCRTLESLFSQAVFTLVNHFLRELICTWPKTMRAQKQLC